MCIRNVSLQEWREGVLVVVSMAAIFLLAVIIVGVKVKRDQRSEAIRNQQINLTIIDMNLDLPLFKCIAHCCLETDANGSAMSLLTTNFVVEVSVMWHLETVCWGSVIYFKWEVSRLSHSDCRYFNTFTSCDESHRACLLGRRESDTCGHDGTSFHSNNKTTYICIHQYHNMCCWYI